MGIARNGTSIVPAFNGAIQNAAYNGEVVHQNGPKEPFIYVIRPSIFFFASPAYEYNIPIAAGDYYDISIDWGDGSAIQDVFYDGTQSSTYIFHQYPAVDVDRTITITGRMTHLHLSGDSQKMVEIQQWGSNKWYSMAYAFAPSWGMTITATDTPDTSMCTTMKGAFADARAVDTYIGDWDVSNCVDFSQMFEGAQSYNQPLTNWNIKSDGTNVDMHNLLSAAYAFNQDVSNLDVTDVSNLTLLMNNTAMSSANVDAALIAWSALSVRPNLTVSMGAARTSASNAAYTILTNPAGANWTIIV